jgi:LacI family transcriptional regulator
MSLNRSPRMSDVANFAGVAIMTVSRVINGNQNVSADTRQRVLRAIDALKYRPNAVARSLREQRSRQIGVIVPNISDPFFAICAQAVSDVARDHGYSLNIAMSGEDSECEFNEAIQMLQRSIEGLIVIPAAEGSTRLIESDFADLPLVTLDRPLLSSKCDSVVVQNAAGTKIAVKHLIDHGHRRIAFVGLPMHLYTMKTRYNGYCAAMREAKLKPEAHCGRFEQTEMVELIRKLIRGKKPVTSIFCGNNLTTRSLLHGLAALGVKVPRDVAVIGFDDFETADIINPSVTVVSQPTVEVGRRGADRLFSKMFHGTRFAKQKNIILPVELILRTSCGCSQPKE